MGKIIAFCYGLAAYLVFFFTFLYAIGFVTGLGVPKTIDTGTVVPLGEALAVNILLMSLFAVQHSVMARWQFKRWWTQFVPKSVERSTYVLLASCALILLFWQWRPIPAIVWEVADPKLATTIIGVSLVGWLLVLASTFMINHFELFGVHQVVNNLAGRAMVAPHFKTPALYKLVRHPIYLGFIIAFWAAPVMTVGHLLFAAVTTAYIFVGIVLEERDLIKLFGNEYIRYRERVSMLIPSWPKSS
jgi:protein-S-isoprenylcysteine O-methyltransferase Ste14